MAGERERVPGSPWRRPLCWLALAAVLSLGPLLQAREVLARDQGLMAHLRFGQFYFGGPGAERTALPEVQALDPPRREGAGYDGQFYAQLALDPLLQRPDDLVRALDLPSYRARRVGLPLLAWLLGGGRPEAVLAAYVLLNYVFWALLVGLVIACVRPSRPEDHALAAALALTAGTLTSVGRSLTDLPATALMVWAAFLVEANRAGLAVAPAALALLCRDALLLSLPALLGDRGSWRGAARCLAAALPLLLWAAWAQAALAAGKGLDNPHMGLPFAGVAQAALADLADLARGFRFRPLTDLLGLASLGVQAAYFLLRRRPGSAFWRGGVAFALLLPFLGELVLHETLGFSRVLLPLTCFFNLLVWQHERGPAWAWWYVLGNGGLAWPFLESVYRAAVWPS